MRKWLGAVADVVTAAVGVALLVILGLRFFSPSPPELSPPDTITGVYVDESLGIDFQQAKTTLVLALREGCPACEASIPFYQRLTGSDVPDVQVVVAVQAHETEIASYLASREIKPDSVVFLTDPYQLPIVATPTLILVDQDRLVTHTWIGLLSRDAEEEVFPWSAHSEVDQKF